MVNSRLIATVAITSLVFLLGIFFGQQISYYNLSELKQTQEKMLYEMIGYELTYFILSEKDICNISFTDLMKERATLGQKVADLEERFGPENEEVKSLKERYLLYQIREYLFFKKLNQECDKSLPLILLFYSHPCDLCIAQGRILDAIYIKNKTINIYAMDYEIENPALEAIKDSYKINTTPSLVINEKTYNRFLSFEELNNILYGAK